MSDKVSMRTSRYLPSLEYERQWTASLCAFSGWITVPSFGSYTKMRLPTATRSCVPSGLKAMS